MILPRTLTLSAHVIPVGITKFLGSHSPCCAVNDSNWHVRRSSVLCRWIAAVCCSIMIGCSRAGFFVC
jgi:hypothetical protein